MKAIRISGIGERLTQTDIAVPTPAAGEVLVAVRAAGICHSDAHYRSGIGSLGQFCPDVAMIGKDGDGGYAEFICVPERNAFTLPGEIPFTHAAVMMCSFATALHALRKARFAEGESVAIFGVGGLGTAAIALSAALGASSIIAIDNIGAKIKAARSMGAIGIDACDTDVVEAVIDSTDGRGVDVALEFGRLADYNGTSCEIAQRPGAGSHGRVVVCADDARHVQGSDRKGARSHWCFRPPSRGDRRIALACAARPPGHRAGDIQNRSIGRNRCEQGL
jgi:D-arabinose 1-dehydrogenase-like Zn-dependent alcohol dehydrogenase